MEFRFLDDNRTFSISKEFNISILSRINSYKKIENDHAIANSFDQPLMSNSLTEILKNKKNGKICIVISDIITNSSIKKVFNELIKKFDDLKIPEEHIQIIIANADRKKNYSQEIKDLIGKQAVYRYDIINHDANDQEMNDYIGESKNTIPIYLNKHYLKAEIRIILNLVEPHFFFKYNTANLLVIPGICGNETISYLNMLSLKNYSQNNKKKYTSENLLKNSVEIYKLKDVRPHFLIEISSNSKNEIIKIFSGSYQIINEMIQFHEMNLKKHFQGKYDVVVIKLNLFLNKKRFFNDISNIIYASKYLRKNGILVLDIESSDTPDIWIGNNFFNNNLNADLLSEILNSKLNYIEKMLNYHFIRILLENQVRIFSNHNIDIFNKFGLQKISDLNKFLNEYLKKNESNKIALLDAIDLNK